MLGVQDLSKTLALARLFVIWVSESSALKLMTMKIITVRHGATQFSQEKRIAGWLDEPLSELGIMPSKALQDFVSQISYDVVISSPLSRALKTAQYCTRLKLNDILVYAESRERNYGKMQGLLPQEIP